MHKTAKGLTVLSQPEYSIFRGPKTSSCITYKHGWHLALLVKLSLDLDVISISVNDKTLSKEAPETLSLSVKRRSQVVPLDVIGIHDDQVVELEGAHNQEVYRRSEILDDPNKSNSLEVWAKRSHHTDLALRMRILTELHSSFEQMTFEAIRSKLNIDITRLVTALSLMRIEGLIDFDLSRPIHTIPDLKLVQNLDRALDVVPLQ
ncbi:hypothetical protein [Ahrensia sp. 13_GOM-1096m]|uniref:hypothetical protein n=1 Tax=Ahrensia sp. 13_GOM-1096m TaxID=1380380 RepID=UPI000478E99D|nr:hypothetical protein [Ahrensia sp. 13_GOM-1096m]